MGPSLFSLCVPSVFGGRAGFDVNTSHVFPQSVLAAITLEGGGAGDGGAKVRTSYEVAFLSAQRLSPPSWDRVSSPKLLQQKP